MSYQNSKDMERQITFNEIPQVLMDLSRKVDIILNKVDEPQSQVEDKLFTIEELQNYLPEKPARQTVYGWVNLRLVPFEKYSKRLYFRKSDIDSWIANGRRIKRG